MCVDATQIALGRSRAGGRHADVASMSESRGPRSGHLLALAGAGIALASLWAPWYRLHLPAALREMLQQRADAYGPAAGNFIRAMSALIPDSISGDAWLVFTRTDVLIALISALVIVTLLAGAGAFGTGVRVAGESAARAASVAGTVGGLAVAARMIDPPGPNAYLDVRWGAWACLLGCARMVAGGLMAGRTPVEAAPAAAFQPPVAPAAAVADSVAPPG
jgi:hypothetical protein